VIKDILTAAGKHWNSGCWVLSQPTDCHPIGIYSAIRQDTGGDYLARSFANFCIAVPNFWVATLVIVFPSLWWGYSPPIRVIHFGADPIGNLKMFIFPALVLGMEMSGMDHENDPHHDAGSPQTGLH